mgnify:CR=1 FL=1
MSRERGRARLAGLSDEDERALLEALAHRVCPCLLYTSDAADERSSVDLGGRRIIKKKKINEYGAVEVS